MNKTIGILAHVDAGKTTLSEQILFHAQTIRTRGRVDHQNTFLDCHPLERERGITIFSDQAVFSFGGARYILVDTPGHVDFSGEMERAVQIMDLAVVVVDAVAGVQGHTGTVWQLLRRYGVPVFFFLNKTDREGADPDRVIRQLRTRLSAAVCPLSSGFAQGELSEEAVEQIAELDEPLLEQYLEGGYSFEPWLAVLRREVAAGRLFPCLCGSALLDEGVEELLQALHLLVPDSEHKSGFSARAYKVRHDSRGSRLVFLKLTGGELRVKDEVEVRPGVWQKVDEIRLYSGSKFTPAQRVEAGDLCAVTGLDTVTPGDGIGEELFHEACATVPLLVSKVVFDEQINPRTVLGYFRILEDEDPLLGVEWNEALHELRVHVMGAIQLEVLQELVRERFSLEVSFGECEILYHETIAAPVVGYGHYEPLRHYAEVHLRLSPGPRGSGITFDSECSTDLLDGNYQRLIRTHVFEKQHKGVLTGSPLADVQITLLTGRAHLKHTEGGDFRQAVYRAIRQGLEQAESVLLEPMYAFTLELPLDLMGRALADIQRLHGSFEPPLAKGDQAVIQGRGPVSEFMNYSAELVSYTHGAGRMQMRFDGYQPCHNTQEVIQRIGYDKVRDVDNTSDSIFCSHGAGFPVHWDEVIDYIHCK